MGPIEIAIRAKLAAAFSPAHLEVENESHRHRVPARSETHFRVLIVSAAFVGQSRVARSRAVHDALAAELAAGVRALSVRCHEPKEWEAKGEKSPMQSPPCLGGSKSESH